MLELKYIGESISYPVSFRNVSAAICQITGDFPVKAGGFTLSRIGKDDAWDYSGYSSVYRQIEGGAQFSNDGSIFVPQLTFSAGAGGALTGETTQKAYNYEDLRIPTPEPEENYVFSGWEPEIPASGEIPDHQTFRALFQYVPTLEEVRTEKVNEVQAAGAVAMTSSVEHEGVQYPYAADLRDTVESALSTGKTVIVRGGDGAGHVLEPVSAKALYVTQEQNRVQAQEYTAQLVAHVQELSDREGINAVSYGIELPEERKEQYEQAVSERMSIITAAVDMVEAQAEQARISAENNTDEQAYEVVALYEYWSDIPEGTMLKAGKIVQYSDGILYRVKEGQGHQKQSTWSPDTAASLFTPIPKPEESGTEDNPIAWVEGMESEEGKYYVSDGVKYLCIESSGIGLYGKPADLERYFQIVTE